MSFPRAFGDLGGTFSTGFQDPVFEPSPDFNFEEDPNHMMMPDNFNVPGDFALYDANMQPDFPVGPSLHHQGATALPQGDPQSACQQDIAGGTMPPSGQDDIVGSRADSVTQFLGQITPPQTEMTAKQAGSTQLQESDAVRRKERARNAANKRHAKRKKSVAASVSAGGDDEEATEDRGERQAHYREKNRVAAAKCRAKKKNHNDHLEDMHRDEASKNKVLKAELMGLRNELAQLKGLTLEHSPDNCHCHGIHEYSMRQASLIAHGAAPQYSRATASPAQESSQSADTPVSDAPGDSLFSGHDQTSARIGNMSRRTSSFGMGNWM